jgi:esterase/lipase superfamily enzyme
MQATGRLAVRTAAFLFFAMFAGAFPARALDPIAALAIEERVNAGETAEALKLIETALSTEPEGEAREELLQRKSEVAEKSGDLAEARNAAVAWAEALSTRLGANAPELVELFSRIADLSAKTGETALEAEALAEALRVCDANGDTVGAQGFAARLKPIAVGDGEIANAAREALSAHDAAAQSREAQRDLGPGEEGFTRVKLYYATDRARTGDRSPSSFYGGDRSDGLELGELEVSVPNTHVPGKIEKPSIWTFDFREDPERHIVLQSVTPMPQDTVFAHMRSHLGETGSDEAFVFVHGFNVSFEGAAKRAAQIARDMNFDGLPIVYSWPSRNSIFSYIADTAVVNLSGRRLLGFLEDVVRQSGAKRIHLIAHSMGNRALTDALELYAVMHRGEPPAFDQVLFTAPDLDAGLFKAMAKTIRPVARRLTLYTSDHDWALAVSRRLHGDMPRAGQSGKEILLSDDFDSVDMSLVGEDMLAHSYFANNPSALTDILSLFWRDTPPRDRCGMVAPQSERGWWLYSPERCDSNAMLSALAMLREHGDTTLASASRNLPLEGATPEEKQRIEAAVGTLMRAAKLDR